MAEDRTQELLHEILLWMRFQNRQTFKTLLNEVLSSDADRRIYNLSDGERSQPEIARAAGVSQPTVSLKWKAWKNLGIVYEVPNGTGRCRHLASLGSFVMDDDRTR